jgi:hypothetical protein
MAASSSGVIATCRFSLLMASDTDIALPRGVRSNRAVFAAKPGLRSNKPEAGVLSMKDAGELLGVSERQFRRFRDRYEEDGEEGLRDRRLGRPSPKKVPAVERSRMLKLYRETYRCWNVKHFHEHLTRDHGFRWGYTCALCEEAFGTLDRASHRCVETVLALPPGPTASRDQDRHVVTKPRLATLASVQYPCTNGEGDRAQCGASAGESR